MHLKDSTSSLDIIINTKDPVKSCINCWRAIKYRWHHTCWGVFQPPTREAHLWQQPYPAWMTSTLWSQNVCNHCEVGFKTLALLANLLLLVMKQSLLDEEAWWTALIFTFHLLKNVPFSDQASTQLNQKKLWERIESRKERMYLMIF